ncbi:DUF6663 family protein [Halorarum halobium]|uniref:DUF6663 family protein n=1 Tax=Halorarum halobium TaxID=3075121 RepID=UPI0028AA2FC4|nr:DUF6663 family protein [Halobaculum sp. XH14]
MEATTDGRFRVLSHADDEYVLVDLTPVEDPADAYEPVRVAAEGYGDDLAESVAELEPGVVVDAELIWTDGEARFRSVSVRRRGRVAFADDVENLFEAARETWRDARAAGDAMASRVTRDTDGEPNGALYVFADAGARDLLAEFRSGTTPLEPLIERVNAEEMDGEATDADPTTDDGSSDPSEPPEREAFVLRPRDGEFVVVYVAFEPGGLLARTVRDTYF